jgi:aspartate/glutamate racemase
MSKNTYGFIGGYGTVASVHLQNLLVQSFTVNKTINKDSDFPNYIVTNLPKQNVIDLTGSKIDIKALEDFLDINSQILSACSHIFVLCNSFHSQLDLFQKHLGTKVISLPEATKTKVLELGFDKPLIVGSSITADANLYASTSYQEEYVDSEELILAGIRNQNADMLIQQVIETALRQNRDSIVLACTDLSIHASTFRQYTDLPVIDSLEITVQIIIKMEEENESL